MPLSDLKNTRLVSTSWNDESQKYFLRRARVELFLKHETVLDTFLQFTKPHNNFTLSYIDVYRELNLESSSTELFNMVLSNGSVIKSLRLMIVNLNDFKHNFLDVLCYLPHLEELSLHVNIKCLDMWAKRDMDEFFQPKTLPLLRKLDMY
jgi:hypothetical protein